METPSNEVLAEMLRNIRDESLPALHNKVDNMNSSLRENVKENTEDIKDLKTFQDNLSGQLTGIKWLVGALSAVFALILSYFAMSKR